MTTESDEVKLHSIKEEIGDVITTIKTMISTYTAMGAQELLLSGEIGDGPEKDYFESEEYKKLYILASKANTELFATLIKYVDRIAANFGMEFINDLPKNQEELSELQKELIKEYEIE